jgi:hypothetical protein
MKPIKLQRMKRTNFYTPARRVWFQKNDDYKSRTNKEDEWDGGKSDLAKQIRKERRMAATADRRTIKNRAAEGGN